MAGLSKNKLCYNVPAMVEYMLYNYLHGGEPASFG